MQSSDVFEAGALKHFKVPFDQIPPSASTLLMLLLCLGLNRQSMFRMYGALCDTL
jgi:hypothetical protein